MANYKRGLEYYKDNLFLENGSPKWMNDKVYPLDSHGAAQGIISFVKAAQFGEQYENKARTIALWIISNMQNKKNGYFYYQKHRFYTKRFTLMRWCNAWMARALAMLMRRIYAK